MFNNPFGYGMGMSGMSSMPGGMAAAGSAASRGGLNGLLGGLFGRGAGSGAASAAGAIRQGINWSGLLSNTQKTLGIINQAIPIAYQVKPIVNNARTMFKIADAVKDPANSDILNETLNSSTPSEPSVSTESVPQSKNTESSYSQMPEDNKPIFYL